MATAKQNPEAVEAQRAPAYPYYSLARVLQVGEVLRELGGANTDVQKSLLAQRLELGEDSATLLGVIGAARLFGVLDGRGSYRLTEIAKDYFLHTSPDERRIALLQMAKAPPLYAKLIERFDGQRLPSPEVLINVLHREHNVSESWRPRVASFFVSTMRDASAVDSSGFLRVRASLDSANNGRIAAMNDALNPPSLPEPIAAPIRPDVVVEAAPAVGMDVWTYRIGNHRVRLETSPELSVVAWNKLNQYVQVLKPGDEHE